MKCRNDSCGFNSCANGCLLRRKKMVLSEMGVCEYSGLAAMLLLIQAKKSKDDCEEPFDMTDKELIDIANRLLEMAGMKTNRANPKQNSGEDENSESKQRPRDVAYKNKLNTDECWVRLTE